MPEEPKRPVAPRPDGGRPNCGNSTHHADLACRPTSSPTRWKASGARSARCTGRWRARGGPPRRALRQALRDPVGRRNHGHDSAARAGCAQGPGRARWRVLPGLGRRHRRAARRTVRPGVRAPEALLLSAAEVDVAVGVIDMAPEESRSSMVDDSDGTKPPECLAVSQFHGPDEGLHGDCLAAMLGLMRVVNPRRMVQPVSNVCIVALSDLTRDRAGERAGLRSGDGAGEPAWQMTDPARVLVIPRWTGR
jgi:hypothetical protein